MRSPCRGSAEQNWQSSSWSRASNGSVASLQERHVGSCLRKEGSVLDASWDRAAPGAESVEEEVCGAEEGEVVGAEVRSVLRASFVMSSASSSSSVQRKGAHMLSVSARHSKAA